LAANRLVATPTGLAGRYRKLAPPTSDAGSLGRALRGKVVLVTGASSGIGAATARLLGTAGGTVLLVARGTHELERVRAEIAEAGSTAQCYPCDLADFAALDAMVAKVLAEHGRVDILVNNAGHSIRRKAEHSAERFHDFERLIQLNYLAAVRLTLGLLPAMRERGEGQVVNISTWAVQLRPARYSGYVASKAALEAWTDCVQSEVQQDGVRFTTVRMPLVRTPMIAPTTVYRRLPALSAEQAAHAVGDAIVCRPRRLRPAFWPLIDLGETLSPRSMDRVRSRIM
jgi:NAD(P)-dependent dehydrogenase (short-subunit alcohol dehydrogenase family)